MSFNLAIEMLFMSGPAEIESPSLFGLRFQSRNRDAFHVRQEVPAEVQPGTFVSISQSRCFSCQARTVCLVKDAMPCYVSISQSRCFSCQGCRLTCIAGMSSPVSISQSRCFSCQGVLARPGHVAILRFNLAIEMLFMSGGCQRLFCRFAFRVSISQSRCFSCQVKSALDTFSKTFQSRNRDAFHVRRHGECAPAGVRHVSISQSRCFSCQVYGRDAVESHLSLFQSRNRDAFHVRGDVVNAGEDAFQVSISQSRCFSCQARAKHRAQAHTRFRFNLAIEMLFMSGAARVFVKVFFWVSISQSRCFSCQGRACGAPDTPWLNARTSASVHFQHDGAC